LKHARDCVSWLRAGLLPDVAFARMAAERMPLYVGLYLALIGARVDNPSDLLAIGMATHYVESKNLPALKDDLLSCEFSPCSDTALAQAVERHSSEFPRPTEHGLQANINLIQTAMAPGLAVLGERGSCVEALAQIVDAVDSMASPFSCR
jgi:Enoyl-CoA hydratase/isomerase